MGTPTIENFLLMGSLLHQHNAYILSREQQMTQLGKKVNIYTEKRKRLVSPDKHKTIPEEAAFQPPQGIGL